MKKKIFVWLGLAVLSLAAMAVLAHYAFAATSTAQITFPSDNATVTGAVDVRGTAAGPDFDYYKVEFAFPGSGAWVLAGNKIYYEPVTDGTLASLDTTKLPDGDYALRLLVADKNGQYNTAQVVVAVNNTKSQHTGKGPERGCMACHVQRDETGFPTLYWESLYATDNDHPTLANGYAATYADCMNCHASSGQGDRGVGAPLSLRAIVHPAHSFSKLFTEIEYDGNCFSCHNVAADGKWDVLVDAMLVNDKGVPLVIKATPTLIPAPTKVTPTPDPAIYNQVPKTTVFEPGQCTAVLNASAPAYTSSALGGQPNGEIPPGEYSVGAAAQYSTSLWYMLNEVTSPNYINSTSVAELKGNCNLTP
ncbi:hypothetical protein FBQ82_01855 [Anaerolineae bacterium CFX7]|nr:hypothetical protein [Anaerolineae bacterium CFX7]